MPHPERWLELTARVPEEDPARDLLGDALIALGGQSVLEDRSSLTTYLPPPGDLEAYLDHVERFIGEWTGSAPPILSWRWRDDEDWEREWRRGLQPRKVSRRFVVKPSWTAWGAAPDEIIIEIDPQMAFGTGEHASTRGCLRLLDEHLRPGDRVLDVGAGSGILAIAAARAGAAEVVAVECDPDANLNARENIERNGVSDRITLVEASADDRLIGSLGSFDLIVANILSGVIRPLLRPFAAALRPDGRLIVSGILESERDSVVADAETAGLRVLQEDREAEWWTACVVPD